MGYVAIIVAGLVALAGCGGRERGDDDDDDDDDASTDDEEFLAAVDDAREELGLEDDALAVEVCEACYAAADEDGYYDDATLFCEDVVFPECVSGAIISDGETTYTYRNCCERMRDSAEEYCLGQPEDPACIRWQAQL